MKAHRTTIGLFATLGDLPRRRRTAGFLAVLASMTLVVSMTSAFAYADDATPPPAAATTPPDDASGAAEEPAAPSNADQAEDESQDQGTDQGKDESPASTDDAGDTGGDTQSPAPEPQADEGNGDGPADPEWTETPSSPGLLGLVTGQAVPAPETNGSVITVKVGGNRTGSATVGNLAGVKLGLFAGSGDANPVNNTWAVCTSDPDGDCSFKVPSTNRNGANRDEQFWVKEIDPAPSYYSNKQLGTGETVSSADYRFQTGDRLRSGNTYYSGTDFMTDGGNSSNSASGGVWQNSRNNPSFPPKCGIKFGMLLDLSSSVGSSGLSSMKTAAKGFVDALAGTPSQIGLFTFATSAPASSGNTLGLTSVATPEGVTTVKDKIDGYNLPGGDAGGTNWDRGLWQVQQAAGQFDVLMVLTDGNPTFYGASASGPGGRTRFRELENGIFSANAVKAQGTRIVAFGVGSGVNSTASGYNLRAISGPTKDTDYFQTASYDAAGQKLAELAKGNCTGKLNITKMLVDSDSTAGNLKNPTPDAGWQFDVGPSAAGSNGITVSPSSQSTDAQGGASFTLDVPGGVTNGNLDVTEVPDASQSGYTLLAVQCTGGATPASPTVTGGAFTINVTQADVNNCVVYNKRPASRGALVIEKRDAFDNSLITGTAQGATFQVTPDPTGGAGPLTVTDGGAGDPDGDVNGTITFAGAPIAVYTVVETAAPTGYLLPPVADRTKTADLVAAGAGATVTVTFLDHKVWQPLRIDKTVSAEYDASYAWSLDKAVKVAGAADGTYGPTASQNVAADGTGHGTGTFTYRIRVTEGAQTRSNYRVRGTVTVTNDNGGNRIMRATLSDTFSDGTCTFTGLADADPGTPGLQVDVEPGPNPYPYTCDVTGTPTVAGSNTATATWSRKAYPAVQTDVTDPAPGNATATVTKPVAYAEDAATNASVVLSDNQHTFTPDPYVINWTSEGHVTELTYSRDVTTNAGTCTGSVNTAAINDQATAAKIAEKSATATVCTPHYTLAKASTPATGSTVMPGDEVLYKLTVKNDSATVLPGFTVTDDLSGVLGSVEETEPTIVSASVGTTSFASPTLTWTSTADLAPQAEATLTYKVTVKDGAWDATLTNVASPGNGGECVTRDGCTTTTTTPPVTDVRVRKVDAETGVTLEGATFQLYTDNAPVGTLGDEDELVGTETTGVSGVATFHEILKGSYLVKETQAPTGYVMPEGPFPVTVTDNDIAGQGVEITVENQPTGQVSSLVKAQYRFVPSTEAPSEEAPSEEPPSEEPPSEEPPSEEPPSQEEPAGTWVQMQSDDQVAFGDRVRYTLTASFTGPRLFHDVSFTDFVPGWDPADTTTTTKAELVPGSASCEDSYEICEPSYDDETHLLTWQFYGPIAPGLETRTVTVSFVVTFPELPANPAYDALGFYRGAVWNVGNLNWGEGTPPVVTRQLPRLLAAAAITPRNRVSNAVISRATAVAPAPPLPPVVSPPTVKPPSVKPPKGLPSTGGPHAGWAYAGGALTILGGGLILLSRRRRQTR